MSALPCAQRARVTHRPFNRNTFHFGVSFTHAIPNSKALYALNLSYIDESWLRGRRFALEIPVALVREARLSGLEISPVDACFKFVDLQLPNFAVCHTWRAYQSVQADCSQLRPSSVFSIVITVHQRCIGAHAAGWEVRHSTIHDLQRVAV